MPSPPGGRPARATPPSPTPARWTGAGLSAYGSPLRSVDAQNSPATRAALASSAPPASTLIRQNPPEPPRSNSACRSLSRRACTARSGNRSAEPSATRCRTPTSSASARNSS